MTVYEMPIQTGMGHIVFNNLRKGCTVKLQKSHNMQGGNETDEFTGRKVRRKYG